MANNIKKEVALHNKLLAMLQKENCPPYKGIAILLEKTTSGINVMARRLKLAGRLDESRKIINTAPLTIEEFQKLPYPYPLDRAKKKIAKKKVAKKKRDNGIWLPAGEGKGWDSQLRDSENAVLDGSLELPVEQKAATATITIDIPVKDLVSVFLKMVRTGGV